MEQAIQPTEQPLAIAPSLVLGAAKEAATALQTVISGKAKKVMFNGDQYLEFEDWQTLARFYGMQVKTKEAQPVEIDGIKGAKASAVVIDVKTGMEVGNAEAYCLRDEGNWKTKPWFQLASMAQTRAGSKALRNVLAWVAVLAGYKPTPAEEMDSVIKGETIAPDTSKAQPGFPDDTEVKDVCPDHGTPFKNGRYGWYCPNKLDDGHWCKQKPVITEQEPE